MLALPKFSPNDREAFSYDEAFAPDCSEKKSTDSLFLYLHTFARKIINNQTR